VDKAQAKAKAEMARRSKARKIKQQTDTEWKAEVLQKLDELWELRKDIQRIAVTLERLAGIESQDSDEEQISWLESEREVMEVQGSIEKGKQREQKLNGVVEKEVRKQEEDNEMEGVEEEGNSSSLVAYSVGTGNL